MKLHFYKLLAMSLLGGCANEKFESLPVSNEQMVAMLMDVHIAEAALANVQGGPRKDSLANLYYGQVAAIHHVERATLDTCLNILQRNPDLSKDIYEKLVENIEKKRLER
jgi:hypothetical protein